MITRIKSFTLPTGEDVAYYRSEGGTCTVNVQFQKHGEIVSATSGSFEDALLALGGRFKTLGITLENLADKQHQTT